MPNIETFPEGTKLKVLADDTIDKIEQAIIDDVSIESIGFIVVDAIGKATRISRGMD